MGDRYGGRDSTYESRKNYYTPQEYVDSARQGQSDYHDNRDRLSDTQYRRSGDLGADRSSENTGSNSRHRSLAHYDDRGSDRYNDRYDDRGYDRRGGSGRDRDYDSEDESESGGFGNKARHVKDDFRQRVKEKQENLDGVVGTRQKDLAATVIGALAGGFLGYEAGHGRPAGALGGALVGGFAGNAIEHHHLKRQNDREKHERRYDSD